MKIPKEVWGENDRENHHSQLVMKTVLENDVNVKNQLYRRGGTGVTGTGANRAGSNREEDSVSYLGGGMTIDGSNHTLGGANKNQ